MISFASGEMDVTKLMIVTGATGSIGEEYLKRLSGQFPCAGISRESPADPVPGVDYHHADLLDYDSTVNVVSRLSFADLERVVLIHPVGRFKFEDPDNGDPGTLDEDVVRSNVATFYNVAIPIMACNAEHGVRYMTMVAFGSVSDPENVELWRSYTEAKNKLRDYLKSVCCWSQRGVMVNISSTLTEKEDRLRPNADRTYWLSPEKVVNDSMETILAEGPAYSEIDIFEKKPGFDRSYYRDNHALLVKWRREMGK